VDIHLEREAVKFWVSRAEFEEVKAYAERLETRVQALEEKLRQPLKVVPVPASVVKRFNWRNATHAFEQRVEQELAKDDSPKEGTN
jgi:hypothetical protein